MEGLVLGQDPGGLGKGARLEEHQAGHPGRTEAGAQLCSSQLGMGARQKEGCNTDPIRGLRDPQSDWLG